MTTTQTAPTATRIYCTRCEAYGCTGTVGVDCPTCLRCDDTQQVYCPLCDGAGLNEDNVTDCRPCRGTGDARCWRC